MCECARPKPRCPSLRNCNKQCTYGFKVMRNGCEKCRCNKCPPFDCTKKCPNGFMANKQGCKLCKCRGNFFDNICKNVMILRINKFLEISPSTAFQARAVTGRWLCLQRCYNSRWTLYCFNACTVTLQSPIDNFVVSDYYLNGQMVYLLTSMYVSPARTYTYKSYMSYTPD